MAGNALRAMPKNGVAIPFVSGILDPEGALYLEQAIAQRLGMADRHRPASSAGDVFPVPPGPGAGPPAGRPATMSGATMPGDGTIGGEVRRTTGPRSAGEGETR